MRVTAIGLCVMLGWAAAAYGADEPVRSLETPDAERIAELIRHLGSQDFEQRERATRKLTDLRLAGKAHLVIASRSPDFEVRHRATQILLRLDGLVAQDAFLAAMKGPWPAALKEGRLDGPLLGAAETNGTPSAANLNASEAQEAPDGELAGLRFLARAQSVDGHWSTQAFGAQLSADVEQTALALLAFLGARHTEKVGTFKETVIRAVSWLKSRQQEDGVFLNEGWAQVDGVTHALAVAALSEAANMANEPETKNAAQRGIDFSAQQQDPVTGGFSRGVKIAPDLLTTTLHCFSFRLAKVAGLKVPQATFAGITRFLDSVEDKEGKTYRFVAGGKPSTCAAVLGLVCREFVGCAKGDLREVAEATLKELRAPTFDRNDSDLLINYFGTVAAFKQGGDVWVNWNGPLKENLMNGQLKSGPALGAWPAKGVWGGGGYTLSTAFGSLTLAFYHRYLPILK